MLENEIQKQILFFVVQGRESFEYTGRKWHQKEKALAVISNAVVIISLLAIFFIALNLAKKLLRTEYKILKISEEKYKSIFNNSLDGIYKSTQEGKFIDVNPAFVKMLGYQNKQELLSIYIPIVHIVKEVLKLLRATLPAMIEIHQNFAKDVDIVNADPTQMHQILMNLCTNASHAMPEGGVLEISLVNVELNEEFCAKYEGLTVGPHVRLSVSDTGCGIDKEILLHVFQPFFTTKAQGQGTGMGLSVVHGIVKSNKGHILVYSEPCIGTTFHVYFPAFVESIHDALPEIAKPAPKGSESILFVDDEPMITEIGRETLKRLGYSVTTRTSSVEALELFRIKSMGFNLVITDQTMPHMTGIDLAKEMLHIRSDIPIILCTGFSNTVTLNKALASGIREYVMKPVLGNELGRIVRHVLDENQHETRGKQHAV